MGERRIAYVENCLMTIAVQVCHVVSTFQAGVKRKAKNVGW